MTTHHSPVVRSASSSHLSARSGALRLMAILAAFLVAGIGLSATAYAAKKPVRVTDQQIARGKKMCAEADKLFAAGKTTEALKKYKEVLAFLPESPWAKRGIAKCQAGSSGGEAPAANLAPEAPGSAGSGKKAAPVDAGDGTGDGAGGGIPAPMKGGLALLALVVVFGLVKAVRRKRAGRGDAVVDAPVEPAPAQDAVVPPIPDMTTEDASSAGQVAAAAVVAAAATEAAAAEPEAPAAAAGSTAEEFSFDDLQTPEAPAATADNPFAAETAAPADQSAAEEEPSPFDLPSAPAAEEPAAPAAEAPAGPFAQAPAAPEAKPEEPAPASTFISFAEPEGPVAPAPVPAAPEVAAEGKEELPAAFVPFTEPEPAAAPEVEAREEQPEVEPAAPPVFAPFEVAEEPAPAAAPEEESAEAAEPSPPPAYSPFGVTAEPAAADAEAPTPFGAVEEPAEAASPFGAVEEAGEAPSPFGAVAEEETAAPFAPAAVPEAESAPLPFGAQEEEEAPAVFPGLAAAPAVAAAAAAVDRESASERARLWWETAGTSSDTCEVCGAVMQRGEGFHLDTSQMAASASYVDFDTRMQTMLGLDEEAAATQVQERLGSHAEAWHVCEQCLSQHFDSQ